MNWTQITDDEGTLPPLEVPVWLVDETRNPWIGCRTMDDDGWMWASCYDDWYFDRHGEWKTNTADCYDLAPTHWQYLPEPPPMK